MTINEMYTGYCDDYSMSVRARAAYDDGERPLSKWTKSAIIAACADLLDTDPDAAEKLDALKHHTLSTLKSNLLTYSSWHHTSKMYNCTNFYAINDDTLTETTPAEIRSWQPTKKNVQQPPTRRRGTICYLIWGGTRNHPRAWEKCEQNVWIEERGQFYHIYRHWNSRDCILRKKRDSRGTVVTYAK